MEIGEIFHDDEYHFYEDEYNYDDIFALEANHSSVVIFTIFYSCHKKTNHFLRYYILKMSKLSRI